MPEQGVGDRRIFERFPLELSLQYVDPATNQERQAQVHDMSAAGMGPITDHKISPNANLWFHIPYSDKSLFAKGAVVWENMVDLNKYRVGIRFDNADILGIAGVIKANLAPETIPKPVHPLKQIFIRAYASILDWLEARNLLPR